MTVRYKGRAVINPFAPTAVGQCDRCNGVYNRSALQPQMQYSGFSIIDTGLRVCDTCLDPLDPQQLPYRPRFDPAPVVDPRPFKFGDAYVRNWTLYPATGWARFRGHRPTWSNVLPFIVPSVAALSWSGHAPSVALNVPTGFAQLTWTALAPQTETLVHPAVGQLAWASTGPAILLNIPTGNGALSWSGLSPSWVNALPFVNTGAATLSYTGPAPTWTNVLLPLDTGVGALTYNGNAPSLSISVAAGFGQMSWAGPSPSGAIKVYPNVGVLSWSGPSPTPRISVTPGTATLSWTGFAPSYKNIGGFVGFAPLGQFALGETP